MLKAQLKKGVIGELAQNISRRYTVLHCQDPDASEMFRCERLWSFWKKQNCHHIWSEENEYKISRFDEIIALRETIIPEDDIFKLFADVIYIETGITFAEEKKRFNLSMKIIKEKLLEFLPKTEIKRIKQNAKDWEKAIKLPSKRMKNKKKALKV